MNKYFARFLSIMLATTIAVSSVNSSAWASETNFESQEEAVEEVSQNELSADDGIDGFGAIMQQIEEIENSDPTTIEDPRDEEEIAQEELEKLTVEPETAKESSREVLAEGQYTYYLDENNYAHIVGCDPQGEVVLTIPVTLGSSIVISIEEAALTSLTSISKVEIPFYVRYIDGLPENVTVQAYHGSYALYYAQANGYSSENLSEFDFADGVYDYSEIIRSNYSFISDTKIEMNKYEGAPLEVGAVFYLPVTPVSEYGDILKVTGVQENGDRVMLACARAIGAEALKTLVIHATDLKPDWDKAIYYFDTDSDGVEEEIEAADIITDGETLDFVSEDAMMSVYSAGVSFSTKFEKDIATPHKNFLAHGATSESSFKIKADFSTTLSTNIDVDIDFVRCEVNHFEMDVKADTTTKLSVGGEYSFSQPLCEVPVIGVPGIVGANAEISLNIDASGEASLSFSASTRSGVKYANSTWTPIRENDGTVDINAEAVVDAYVQLSMKAMVLGLAEGSVFVKFGIECAIKGGLSTSGGTSAKIEIYLFLKVGSKAKFFTSSEFSSEWPAIKTLLKEINLMPKREGVATIEFVTGKTAIKIPSVTANIGMSIKEPFVAKWGEEAVVGWYTDAKYTKKWDFEKDTVTEDTVLYAKWAKAFLVTYKYNISGVADATKYVIAGSLVPRPIQPSVANYTQKGWYTDSACTSAWSFASGLMPKRNLTLYGKYEKGSGEGSGSTGDTLNLFTFSSNYDGTITVTGYKGEATEIVIPDYISGKRVTDVNGSGVWTNRNNIKSITFPASLTSSIKNFFSGWTGLEIIRFEEGTTQILGTYTSGYVKSIVFPSSLRTISADFSNCKSLSSLSIPSGVTYISSGAFKYCEGLTQVSIGGNTVLGTGVFSNCKNLKKATFGNGTDKIPAYTFQYCTSLTNVEMPNSVQSIGSYAFNNCTSLTQPYLGTGVTSIGEGAYSGSGLVSAVLPDGLEYIDENAFSYCTSLKEIVIPNTVTGYGECILEGSYSLENITVPCFDFKKPGESGEVLSLFATRSIYVQDFTTPASFTITACDAVSPSAFYYFEKSVKEVNLPENLTKIGNSAFAGCSLLTNIHIPDTVQSIGWSAFANTGLTSVNIPRDIEFIGSGAFSAPNLENYTCTDGASIVGGFSGCTKLSEVYIPSSVTKVEENAFYNCDSLTYVNIPSNVREIGKSAFYDCDNIEEIVIEDGTQTILGSAFSSCDKLRKLVMPSTAKKIESGVISGCYSLEDLTTPVLFNYSIYNNQPVYEEVFLNRLYGFDALRNPDAIKSYSSLKYVTLVGNTTIFFSSFKNWSSLEYVKISDTIMGQIGESAFSGCTSLKQVIIPDDITYISNSAFYNCKSLESINIPDKVWYIGDNAFNSSGLKNIKLPSGLKFLGIGALARTKIEEIVVPNGIETLDRGVFAGCANLKSITTPTFDPESENGIGELNKLFDKGNPRFGPDYDYPDNLEKITLTSSLSIPSNAFSGKAIKELYTLENVSSAYSSSFSGCDSNLVIYAPYESCLRKVARECGYEFRDIRGNIAPVTFIDKARDVNYTEYLPVGNKIEKPQDNIDLYSEFDGWYLDEDYSYKWNFDQDIIPREGVTLYARRINEDNIYVAGGYLLRDYGDGVEIVSYVANEAYVYIPSVLRGKKVVKICKNAFSGNESLYVIVVPSTVEVMYSESFENVIHLIDVKVDENNSTYCVYNGHIYTKDMKELVFFMPSNVSVKFTVPEGVERIGDRAFESSKLEEITLSNSVKSIGRMAFSKCSKLKVIYLGSSVEYIDPFATFGLDGVEIRVTDNNPAIENYVDSNGLSYNRYRITCKVDGETIIDSTSEAGKTLDKNLVNALTGFKKGNLHIGELVDTSDNTPFDINSDLMPSRDLVLEGKWISDYEYKESEGGVILTKANDIKADCIVPNVIDGNAVVGIAKGVYTSTKVKSVTIPDTVKKIETGAINLKATIFADKDSYAYSFAKTNKIAVSVRKYLVLFETNGGSSCENLYLEKDVLITTKPVTVKDNYIFTGWYTDKECSHLWNIDTESMPAKDMVLYAGWKKIDSQIPECQFSYNEESDGTVTITGYIGTESEVLIPSKINGMPVTKIAEQAMADNEVITRVTVPDSLKEIGTRAWARCENLNSVDLSQATQLETIPLGCFTGDSYLYEVLLPNSIKEIGNYAFASCIYLQDITLSEGITKIGIGAFYNNKKIKSISLPDTLTEIDKSFVDGCEGLEAFVADSEKFYDVDGILYNGSTLVRCPQGYKGDVKIPSTTLTIGEEAFKDTVIISLSIPDSVGSIKNGAFLNCKKLKTFTFGDDSALTEIGNDVWNGCDALESLTIGKKVTKIGSDIFWGDKELTVRGYANSAIEEYAKKNRDFKFEYIDGAAIKAMAPEVENAEYNTVILKPVEGYEYQYEGSEWQSSNVFAGLQPYTEYTFYQRVAANGFRKAGETSEGTIVTTGMAVGKSVRPPVIKEIRSTAFVIAPVEGAEYSLDGIAWTTEVLFEGLECSTEYTVCQRMAATENSNAGAIATTNVTTLDYDGICQVIFDAGEGVFANGEHTKQVEYEHDKLVKADETPTREKWEFVRWILDDKPFYSTYAEGRTITITAEWRHERALAPTADKASGTRWNCGETVSLETASEGAVIYYTVDGTTPTTESNIYTEPIVLKRATTTIKAIAAGEEYTNSSMVSFTFYANMEYGTIVSSDRNSYIAGDGFWVGGLRNMTYTGKAIKQSFRLYDENELLTENIDYTVTYASNVNAGKAKITIKGKGNYSGQKVVTFDILPENISNSKFTANSIIVDYSSKKAQSPAVVLSRDGKKLTNKKDYTVEWTNENGMANGACKAPGEYTVLIKGKGNFTGERKITFTITDKINITKATIPAIKSVKYGEGKPVIKVLYKNKPVDESNYDIVWPLNYTAVGKVEVQIVGKGEFVGTRKVSYSVTGVALSKTKMTGYAAKIPYEKGKTTYTQDNVKFTDGTYELIKDTDYTVKYEKNTLVGTATVTYTGKNKYTGTVKKTFAITGIDIKKAIISGVASSYGYTSAAISPEFTLTYKGVNDVEPQTLVKNVDYTVTYSKNVAAGTATVTVTGKGIYFGSNKKTYKISPYNMLTDVDGVINVSAPTEVQYVKNGSMPPVKVTFKGKELTAGTDYTVKYTYNKAVTKETDKYKPTISISGKGNFAGKMAPIYFTILPQDISTMTMVASDKPYSSKANSFATTVTIKDPNCAKTTKLVAGTDYNKTLEYSYASDVTVTQLVNKTAVEVERKAGDTVDKADIIPVNAVIRVKAVGKNNYNETIDTTYRIIKKDIAKATVKVDNMTYTGKAITPDNSNIKVMFGKERLDTSKYEVVECTNNTKKGTATLVLQGIDEYGGKKKVTFKIVARAVK